MNKTDRENFLADVHVGVIAVDRPGRAPLTVPIWYAYEPGGDVVLSTTAETLKHKLIRDAGRFALSVQDEQWPYKYVTAEGDVTDINPATEDEFRDIAVRYLGTEAGGTFTKDTWSPESILIRMRPTRWQTADFSAEYSG